MYSINAGNPLMVADTPWSEVGSIPFTKSEACQVYVAVDRFDPRIDSHVAEAAPGWKLPPLPTAVMVGAGCVPCTTRVMAMEAGLPAAPVAATCTVEVYVPAARFAGLMDIDSIAGALPDKGDTASQYSPLVEAVQESVPPPVFVIDTVCSAGAGLPTE